MEPLDWLTRRLASALEALDESDHLVITLDHRDGSPSPRYVQLARAGDEARAETVGNRHLDSADRLDEDELELVRRLGWEEPDVGGNDWRHTDDQLDMLDLARLVLRTIVEVHGASTVGALSFQGPEAVVASLIAPAPATTATLAVIVGYWDHDPDEPIVCPACGWLGTSRPHQELHPEVVDLECPGCDKLLLVVPLPTLEDTRIAAAAGNPAAIAELPDIERWAADRDSRYSQLLRTADQLPDLDGEEIFVIWDMAPGENAIQVLRCDDVEIWREPAFYESYRRFEEVFDLLHERYGDRFRGLHPTQDSKMWLYGDRLGAPAQIDARIRTVTTADRSPLMGDDSLQRLPRSRNRLGAPPRPE